jgi:pyruvate formate lyase activating enzyme
MTVKEVIQEVQKDRVFYDVSDGGITVSGGEPTMQPGFVESLLNLANAQGVHTALETCGEAQWSVLKRLLRFTDLVLYDIKVIDERLHKKLVGTSNAQILSNATKVGQLRPMIFRVPVIPGMNDSEANMRAIATFASTVKGVKEIHLLPYHRLGESKYPRLNLKYQIEGLKSPSDASMRSLKEIVSDYGLSAKIGG